MVGKSSVLSDQNVTIHKSGFSHESMEEVFKLVKPDLNISTISAGSFETQKMIIDCAIAAGVCGFLAPEFSHDSLNDKVQARLPPYSQRAETIRYLQEQSSQSRLEWVGIATGFTLDYGLSSGNLGFDAKWLSATLHGSGDESFAASSSAWIGRVVHNVLKHWDHIKNQYLYACGLVTTANDVVKCLEKSMGKTWEVGRGDVKDCVREAERRIERGFPDAGMFLMERSVLYDESLRAVDPFVKQDARGTLGLDGESLDEIVQSVLHQHEHHGKMNCGCD